MNSDNETPITSESTTTTTTTNIIISTTERGDVDEKKDDDIMYVGATDVQQLQPKPVQDVRNDELINSPDAPQSTITVDNQGTITTTTTTTTNTISSDDNNITTEPSSSSNEVVTTTTTTSGGVTDNNDDEASSSQLLSQKLVLSSTSPTSSTTTTAPSATPTKSTITTNDNPSSTAATTPIQQQQQSSEAVAPSPTKTMTSTATTTFPSSLSPVAPTTPSATTTTTNTATTEQPERDPEHGPVGCYMVYEPSSSGRLMLYYSLGPVPDNAVGFWCPTGTKKIQGFKFKECAGRSELIKGIAGGDSNRRKYFVGWCQFCKLAKSYNGRIIQFIPATQGVAVDIYGFTKSANHPVLLSLDTLTDLSPYDAVAVMPKHHEFLKGVKSIGMTQFLELGNLAGATTKLN